MSSSSEMPLPPATSPISESRWHLESLLWEMPEQAREAFLLAQLHGHGRARIAARRSAHKKPLTRRQTLAYLALLLIAGPVGMIWQHVPNGHDQTLISEKRVHQAPAADSLDCTRAHDLQAPTLDCAATAKIPSSAQP